VAKQFPLCFRWAGLVSLDEVFNCQCPMAQTVLYPPNSNEWDHSAHEEQFAENPVFYTFRSETIQ
jgi:hypothetical protein